MSAMSHAVRDSRTMLRRNIRRMVRYPAGPASTVAVPLVVLFLFVTVFGDTMGAGLVGAAGGRGDYLEYVVPGILLLSVAGAAQGAAISVAMDMTEGIINRFRTMAIARASVLTGHVLGNLIQSVIALAVVIGVAHQGEERLQLDDYAGFGWRQPLIGVALTIFLLSLAGFPGTGGFMGKIYLLQGAADGKLLAGGHTLIPTLKQRLAQPSDIIDLGAIAKGFAVDRALERLRAAGVAAALVDLGGNVGVLGSAPGGWSIGIRDPRRTDRLAAVAFARGVARHAARGIKLRLAVR